MLLDDKKIFLNYIRWKLKCIYFMCLLLKTLLVKMFKNFSHYNILESSICFFHLRAIKYRACEITFHRLRCTHEWQRQKQTAPLKCIYYIIKMTILSMGISNNFVIDKRSLSAIGGCFDFEVRKPTKTTVGNFCNCLWQQQKKHPIKFKCYLLERHYLYNLSQINCVLFKGFFVSVWFSFQKSVIL